MTFFSAVCDFCKLAFDVGGEREKSSETVNDDDEGGTRAWAVTHVGMIVDERHRVALIERAWNCFASLICRQISSDSSLQ